MNLKFYLSFVFAAALSKLSLAQEWNSPDRIDRELFRVSMSQNLSAGVSFLTSKVNPAVGETLKQKIKTELAKIDSSFAFEDWNWICETKLARTVLVHSFILRYANKPYRLDILYYNYHGKIDTWVVQDVSIETEVFGELKNAARAEKLKQNNQVITN